MTRAAFFRYLADGGKVRMIEFHGQPAPEHLAEVRWAKKVQSNAVQFNNGSWLYMQEIKAADFHEVAAGGNRPAVSVGWATYQLVD